MAFVGQLVRGDELFPHYPELQSQIVRIYRHNIWLLDDGRVISVHEGRDGNPSYDVLGKGVAEVALDRSSFIPYALFRTTKGRAQFGNGDLGLENVVGVSCVRGYVIWTTDQVNIIAKPDFKTPIPPVTEGELEYHVYPEPNVIRAFVGQFYPPGGIPSGPYYLVMMKSDLVIIVNLSSLETREHVFFDRNIDLCPGTAGFYVGGYQQTFPNDFITRHLTYEGRQSSFIEFNIIDARDHPRFGIRSEDLFTDRGSLTVPNCLDHDGRYYLMSSQMNLTWSITHHYLFRPRFRRAAKHLCMIRNHPDAVELPDLPYEVFILIIEKLAALFTNNRELVEGLPEF